MGDNHEVCSLDSSNLTHLEVIGIACGGGVSHMGELSFVAHGAHVKQLCRHWAIENKVSVVQSFHQDIR